MVPSLVTVTLSYAGAVAGLTLMDVATDRPIAALNHRDPGWGDGPGQGIIGALNYIAARGGNCVHFRPVNVGGGVRSLGSAPSDLDQDWACLVRRTTGESP